MSKLSLSISLSPASQPAIQPDLLVDLMISDAVVALDTEDLCGKIYINIWCLVNV